MKNCANKLASVYLGYIFTPKISPYDLRDATQILSLPKPRIDYLKCSFSYSGASLRSDFPEELRTIDLLTEALINGSLYRTLTRQICKLVYIERIF